MGLPVAAFFFLPFYKHLTLFRQWVICLFTA